MMAVSFVWGPKRTPIFRHDDITELDDVAPFAQVEPTEEQLRFAEDRMSRITIEKHHCFCNAQSLALWHNSPSPGDPDVGRLTTTRAWRCPGKPRPRSTPGSSWTVPSWSTPRDTALAFGDQTSTSGCLSLQSRSRPRSKRRTSGAHSFVPSQPSLCVGPNGRDVQA